MASEDVQDWGGAQMGQAVGRRGAPRQRLEALNYLGGFGGMLPWENFAKYKANSCNLVHFLAKITYLEMRCRAAI